jgi:hypothetical protein
MNKEDFNEIQLLELVKLENGIIKPTYSVLNLYNFEAKQGKPIINFFSYQMPKGKGSIHQIEAFAKHKCLDAYADEVWKRRSLDKDNSFEGLFEDLVNINKFFYENVEKAVVVHTCQPAAEILMEEVNSLDINQRYLNLDINQINIDLKKMYALRF